MSEAAISNRSHEWCHLLCEYVALLEPAKVNTMVNGEVLVVLFERFGYVYGTNGRCLA